MGDDDPTPGELRALQDERAHAEEREAGASETTAEARAHERRAEKAAYLRDRLAEAERAEREDAP